jgi:hypothetical protein
MRASIPLGAASVRDKQPFQTLDDPLCGFAVPFRKDRAFFYCPSISRASAGGSLLGSVPMSSFVPIVMVSGRSVLSRSAKTGLLFWSVWFIWSVSIICLNQTNQIDQMDQIDQTDRACLRREGHRNSGVPK